MGTIVKRRRKNGSTAWLAQITIKRDRKTVVRESKTFERRSIAAAWIEDREALFARPGAIEAYDSRSSNASKPTLADAIDRYVRDSHKTMGRTKTQVLNAIKTFDIAALACDKIGSSDIVDFAKQKLDSGVQPQTVGNYLSHLGSVFSIARPAWNFPLDPSAMDDARKVTERLGLTSKSKARDRRPTLSELDTLMQHFLERSQRRPSSVPMHRIVAFAIFSTRRQEEIVRMEWKDLDKSNGRVLVRDMKHPGQKSGNDVWCDLDDQAMTIMSSTPKLTDQIFPYTTDAIGAAFTRACKLLGIEDLRFHDLRHEGVSRLFEMGFNIPHVAARSGHRSWTSLKRYTHLRQTGDKYENWRWLEVVSKGDPSLKLTTGGSLPRRRRSERTKLAQDRLFVERT
ncbi:MAG: site-specific integrase [Pseudomonadota bacterium]